MDIKVPFKEAVEKELNWSKVEKEKNVAREHYISHFYRDDSFLSRGKDIDQIKVFEKYFDKDQILILKSEDLFKNPQKLVDQAYRFLNLPPYHIRNFEMNNQRNHKPMNASTRDFLVKYFRPPNQRLYEHLGIDSAWIHLAESGGVEMVLVF